MAQLGRCSREAELRAATTASSDRSKQKESRGERESERASTRSRDREQQHVRPGTTWLEAMPARAQYMKGHSAGRDRMACSASKDKAELMRGDIVASSEGGKAVHDSSSPANLHYGDHQRKDAMERE